MDTILNFIPAVFDWVQSLGATLMMPLMIFIIALILGAKPGKAFRASLTIGAAFIGINLVLNLLTGSLGAAAQAMVARTGVQLDVVDVGWPAAAAIAFGGTVGTWIIPVGIAVNIFMLAIRATKTLNVDIWNFWHFAFTGGLVYAATSNLALSLGVAALNAAIVLFLADWTAPAIQKLYNLPGISIPHGFTAAYVPIAIPLNWVIDRIPGLNKVDADPEAIRRRFGVMGEPLVMGAILGALVGCFAWLGDASVGNLTTQIQKILVLAIEMAAVMMLFPRMVAILMEGLIPVSEAAREFMQKRSGDREFYIGLDSAVLVGHPTAIALGLILTPITIALAIGLSALGVNRILPFADLAVLPFVLAMAAPVTRGNIVRGVIIGTFVIAIGLMIGTAMCDLHTAAAIDANFVFPEGASRISSICDGTNPLTYLLVTLTGTGLGWIGLAVGVLLLAVIIFFYQKNNVAWEAIAGGPRPGDEE
ncbi:MAG: PTS transporter subunit IIC [Anaerolineaceae bacterium]|jgi:PTS system galactitol-specific IIC component|nr:PTS transporter subunit IIC [Anaerolineaceae bacterium]